MTVDCWRLFTLATCFYKIISHHLIAHEMQRDAENAFRRKVPFVSVRFADTLGIARSPWTFISNAVNCRRIYGIFCGEKKTIVNNVSTKRAIPGSSWWSRDARIFGSLRLWRFTFQDFAAICSFVVLSAKLSGGFSNRFFRFFQSFWNSSLEKESFRRSLKVWNSEVSAILGSSVKYDDVSFKTLANRKLLALPQLKISKFGQFRISKRKKKVYGILKISTFLVDFVSSENSYI